MGAPRHDSLRGGLESELVVAASIASLTLALNAGAQPANMTFFVTSVGSGKGADFGGLAGADKHCQSLAPPRVREAAPGTPISARAPRRDLRP